MSWACISTDRMARHPGRPWSTPTFTLPDHVAEHYRTLTPEALAAAQLAHYDRMWPLVAAKVDEALAGAPLVLEGSGVLPGPVAALGRDGVRAVWLTGSPALIEARVRRESGYETLPSDVQAMVRKFIDRSRLYDGAVIGEARRLGLPVVDVTDAMSREAVVEACLAALGD